MRTEASGKGIPPAVLSKLNDVRKHARRIRVRAGIIRALAVFGAVMLIAMVADALLVLHDERVRWALTGSALAIAALASVAWCLVPFLMPRGLTNVAREVDAQLPDLEERYLSLAELSESRDAPEIRGSESLIRKLGEEASEMSGSIDINRVVGASAVSRSIKRLALVVFAWIGAIVWDPSQTTILFQRFWSPASDLSLTRIKSDTGDIVVGKGENISIDFSVEGRPVDEAILHVRSAAGPTETVRLRQRPAELSPFNYIQSSVSKSFEYRAEAGHGQTPWHRVTVANRPELSEVRFRIVPPEYSGLSVVEQAALPHRVRALEGSKLEIGFRSHQNVNRFELQFGEGENHVITAGADGAHRFEMVLTNEISFKPVLIGEHQLENRIQPTCRVMVYRDEPPSVSVRSPDDVISARPDDKVKIEFQAADDFGVARAELIVTPVKQTNSPPVVISIPLETAAGAENIRKEVELDLAQFNLKQDDELSYAVRVTDTKQNSQAAAARSSNPRMALRVLDVAAQSSECVPRRILVDEWGKSVEAQMREKLEIAIDPALQELDALLRRAEQYVHEVLVAVRSPEAESQKAGTGLNSAKQTLTQADTAVSNLKAKTGGSPYAFIGLQLDNIRTTDLSPARNELDGVALNAATKSPDEQHLGQARFHIDRARTKLADLTRSYESVKRDYKLSDAMQRLKKMHELLLEDTHAMLGSGKPSLNSVDRKIAEVDDAFVEKLRKLLEEEKRIMAELAKILAEDPRLLRRFMAFRETQAASLRDQLTLIAQRQQRIPSDLDHWIKASEDGRREWMIERSQSHAAEQSELALLAARLRENMMTWLPAGTPGDREPISALLQLASNISLKAAEAELAAKDGAASASASALAALQDIRALHNRFSNLDGLDSGNSQLTTYVANRMTETAQLVTRQSGWIKKHEALRTGDYPQVAEIDQHQIALETAQLVEKLDAAAAMYGDLSSEIETTAAQLIDTLKQHVLAEQTDAADALRKRSLESAGKHASAAVKGLAEAEETFDELLKLIVDELDSQPAPADPGATRSLEDWLALLEQEQQAYESLGIPCRPINISLIKDWITPGSCSNGQQAQWQLRAAQAQSQMAAEESQRLADRARELALQRGAELGDSKSEVGPQRPRQSWNTLVSELGEQLKQGQGNVPPEQYRNAIERYFRIMAEKFGEQ